MRKDELSKDSDSVALCGRRKKVSLAAIEKQNEARFAEMKRTRVNPSFSSTSHQEEKVAILINSISNLEACIRENHKLQQQQHQTFRASPPPTHSVSVTPTQLGLPPSGSAQLIEQMLRHVRDNKAFMSSVNAAKLH